MIGHQPINKLTLYPHAAYEKMPCAVLQSGLGCDFCIPTNEHAACNAMQQIEFVTFFRKS
jgi:hypothetical protein